MFNQVGGVDIKFSRYSYIDVSLNKHFIAFYDAKFIRLPSMKKRISMIGETRLLN